MDLHMISHDLCPYVQRAVIALTEKAVPFRRTDIDLANKPDWFLKLSPLGKTPVLQIGDQAIFESAVIVEYLEDTTPHPLHPADPVRRARHRGWIELASATLAQIAALYGAQDPAAFEAARNGLAERFARVETELRGGPYFAGARFSLVDAAWGPVFRYFDVIEAAAPLGIFDGLPRVAAWRRALAARPSVARAVAHDYPQALRAFIAGRGGVLAGRMAAMAA